MKKHIIISLAALTCTATILQPATGLASQSFSTTTAISEETQEEILPDESEHPAEEAKPEAEKANPEAETVEPEAEDADSESETVESEAETVESEAETAKPDSTENEPDGEAEGESEERPAEENSQEIKELEADNLEGNQRPETDSAIPDTEDTAIENPETESTEPGENIETEATEKEEDSSQNTGSDNSSTEDNPTETPESEEPVTHRPPLVIPELTDLPFEFRFVQNSEAEAAVIPGDTWIYEEAARESEAVGYSSKEALVYVLADGSREWAYVESGRVRGFVKTSDLIRGQQLADLLDQEKLVLSDFRIKDQNGMAWEEAETCVSPLDNDAMTYTKTTAYDPVADKVCAIAGREGALIYDSPEDDGEQQVTGFLDSGAVAYILADEDSDMIYVESGDVRGFTPADSLRTGAGVEEYLLKQEGSDVKTAEVRMDPKENRALYYTVTSTRAADTSVYLRNDLVTYALQFVGNPYVYGGNSLTNGIDCSGFVQQIYRNFGYQLERTADAQSQTAGIQIPIDCALPGDIICYSKGAEVYHVSIYIGNGRTVQAANSKAGIIVTNSIGNNAAWACRVLP